MQIKKGLEIFFAFKYQSLDKLAGVKRSYWR